jgi:PAS domain S-box-containing protein
VPASAAARRRDLLGWVYMPLRISELMDGVARQAESMIDFEVFEGKANDRQRLLYDADGHFEQTRDSTLGQQHFARRTFHGAHTLSLYGQTWTIHTSTRPEFDATANTGLPQAIAVGGIAISLLATLVAWSLARTRARALVLADQMTDSLHANERKLRDSEERLSAILSGAMDPIMSIHADGRLAHFNPAAEQVFGYSADEVQGRDINILMPEPYRSAHDHFLTRYLATGERHGLGSVREVVGRRKNGETFPKELSVSEIRIHGETMFTGIVRDITERKKVERMKTEFVSTVSHELRTPLTSIRGSLGLILGGALGEIPAQVKGLAEIAHSNAERLVRLINDILDIEKIESGKVTFHPVLQSLRRLLEQAIASNQGYAGQHQVSMELVDEAANVMVNVDADRFMQVMSNLLSNAIKYSPRGGVVSVRVTEQLGRTLVQVVDRGAGIPEEFRDRIFTKFSQADSSDTRARGGTGLGVSIAKSLVERMGGTIGYESASGQGTTFHFDLPILGRVQPDGASASAIANRSAEKAGLGRVLYVEDDPDLRQVLQTVARDAAVFEFAENLGQARQMLATHRYDLVLLDIALPDGSGWELLPVVNNLPAPPPVLVFSAHDVGNAHAQEIAATLVKSQTSNEALLATIKSLIERRKAA